MGLIITCIVGGLIGALAGMITGKDFPLGIVGNVIAGLIGSWVGSALFGHWGPEWGGIFILPALLGAIVFILIVTFFSRILESVSMIINSNIKFIIYSYKVNELIKIHKKHPIKIIGCFLCNL